MRHTLRALRAAALLVPFLFPSAGFAAPSASPGMRIISVTARPLIVSRHGLITFTVKVQGIRLSFKHMGKRVVDGEGHLQYYLDHIPNDTWTRVDLHHTFLAEAGTPVLYFAIQTSPVKISQGKHRIFVALAQNNRILYHAPVANVTITVK